MVCINIADQHTRATCYFIKRGEGAGTGMYYRLPAEIVNYLRYCFVGLNTRLIYCGFTVRFSLEWPMMEKRGAFLAADQVL